MESMFSRWPSSQNSHACWKCISHAPDWKNSELFSVSLNTGEKISCPLLTDSALTPALLKKLLGLYLGNWSNFIRTSSRNTMRIQLWWHHHTRHGWKEKARECKHWRESYEECYAESHRNAAAKSSYWKTTVLQRETSASETLQTIPQDSPLPFKAPDHPVRLKCHRTENWLGCKIICKASLAKVASQLQGNYICLHSRSIMYSQKKVHRIELAMTIWIIP